MPSLKTVAAVAGFMLVASLALILSHTNSLLEGQNELEQEADLDRLRDEYQRVVLGCNTEGALRSQDPMMIELCGPTLDGLHADLREVEDG